MTVAQAKIKVAALAEMLLAQARTANVAASRLRNPQKKLARAAKAKRVQAEAIKTLLNELSACEAAKGEPGFEGWPQEDL